MTKSNDSDLLIAICDSIAGGSVSGIKGAARRLGVAHASVFAWINNLNVTIPEYAGEQNVTFARAVMIAHKLAADAAISGQMDGTRLELVFDEGRPVFETEGADVDEEMRDILGFPADGIRRDARGNRVIAKRAVPMSAAEVERYAEAAEMRAEPMPSRITASDTQAPHVAAPMISRDTLSQAMADNERADAADHAAPIEAPEPEPDHVDGLTGEELALLKLTRSPSPLARQMAQEGLNTIRKNTASTSLDRYGVGRTPGSLGSVVR